MDDRLFELLDNLNIRDTNLLLDNDINLSINSSTKKRIEKSIMKKTIYYNKEVTIVEKISNILEEIFAKKKIALAKLYDYLKEATSKTLNNNDVKLEVETESVSILRKYDARKLGVAPGKLNK